MDSTTTTTSKSPETIEPSIITTTKSLPFTNGVLKRHHHHHHHHQNLQNPHPTSTALVIYRECLKNHAATLGGHALDGCGEFMPSPSSIPTVPTSLKCAACGCHRNFHRRDPEEGTHIIKFQPQPQLPPLQPLQPLQPKPPSPIRSRSPISSESPPPISSSYNNHNRKYPNPSSAPHMLLALSSGLSSKGTEINLINGTGGINGIKKRIRSKFSQEQKEKMYVFSERLGWKLQKRDERLVEEFCNEVGVERSVLKVWMHNNKHTFGKIRSSSSSDAVHNVISNTNNLLDTTTTNNHYNNGNGNGNGVHGTSNANCSSSSS